MTWLCTGIKIHLFTNAAYWLASWCTPQQSSHLHPHTVCCHFHKETPKNCICSHLQDGYCNDTSMAKRRNSLYSSWHSTHIQFMTVGLLRPLLPSCQLQPHHILCWKMYRGTTIIFSVMCWYYGLLYKGIKPYATVETCNKILHYCSTRCTVSGLVT